MSDAAAVILSVLFATIVILALAIRKKRCAQCGGYGGRPLVRSSRTWVTCDRCNGSGWEKRDE